MPRNSNQFRSQRHSSHIEPSKKYNQYLVRNQDYGSSPAPKKMSQDRGFPSASEADKESNQNPMLLDDRLAVAVRGKYLSKNPEEIAALRNK